MGLTGFNRQRRSDLVEKVGKERAEKLIAKGFTDVEKLSRIDEVSNVLGLTDEDRKEVKKLVNGKPKTDSDKYPTHKGGGYYILSNGDQVQGKKEAIKAQSELDGG